MKLVCLFSKQRVLWVRGVCVFVVWLCLWCGCRPPLHFRQCLRVGEINKLCQELTRHSQGFLPARRNQDHQEPSLLSGDRGREICVGQRAAPQPKQDTLSLCIFTERWCLCSSTLCPNPCQCVSGTTPGTPHPQGSQQTGSSPESDALRSNGLSFSASEGRPERPECFSGTLSFSSCWPTVQPREGEDLPKVTWLRFNPG